MFKTITLIVLNISFLVFVPPSYQLGQSAFSAMKNNYVNDRAQVFEKPERPPTYADNLRLPFSPAWMDYCDPYHCNDYWKEVCGLNRRKMKFRFFQSGCHLILNNQCSDYRGSLKYDLVDIKHCYAYVMFLRTRCNTGCEDEGVDPVCALSLTNGHSVLFVNQCALEIANCRNSQEYEQVKMDICDYYVRKAPSDAIHKDY